MLGLRIACVRGRRHWFLNTLDLAYFYRYLVCMCVCVCVSVWGGGGGWAKLSNQNIELR